MKNLLFVIAIVFGAISNNVQASNFITSKPLNTVVITPAKSEVNVLCTSIAKGDMDVVVKLIQNGENVNKKSNGLTPAMYAAKYNRVEILEFLVAEGANLRVKCDKGYTALDYAKATNAKDAQQLIESVLAK